MLTSVSVVVVALLVSVVAASNEEYGFAVDIGNDWIKVCVVTPTASSIGSFVDIAINEQSNRKTPAMIGFASADEILIGEEALSLFYKTPSRSFPHLKQLAAGIDVNSKNHEDEVSMKNSFARWSARFQAYKYDVKLRETDTFIEFALPSQTTNYDVPTLYSLFYSYSQQLATKHAATSLIDPSSSSSSSSASSSSSEPSVRQAVVLYPSFFDAEQVSFHKQLATVSGLNVVSMIDELMAVAVDYGVRHTASLSSSSSSPTPLIIWNGGANSITASLFQLSFNAAQNELTIRQLFSSSSSIVGGIDIDLAVRDHLAATFDRAVLKVDTKSTDKNIHKNSIVTNPRAMSKLLREARDLKEQLTVSPVALLQIEELFGGHDFSYTLTKETLDELLAPMLSSFLYPLQQVVDFARNEAGLSELPQVELYGGSLRVRSIVAAAEQQVLKKQSVGRHIDGEEAAVLGAAHYLAAFNGANVIKLQLSNQTLVSRSKHQVLSTTQLSTISSTLSSLSSLSARRAAAARLKNQLESLMFRANELLSSSITKSSSAHNKEQLQQQVEAARSVLEDAEFGSVDEERLMSVTNALSEAIKTVEAAVPKPKAPKEEDSMPRKPRHKYKRPSSSSASSSKPSSSHQTDKKKEEPKKPAASKPAPKPQPKKPAHKSATKEEL